MPAYKLHYFDARGRAEVIRLIFAYKGVEYEDKRYKWEDFASKEIKESMPLEQMPALELDGVRYGQSGAIARYLAREYGLTPECTMEQFFVDMFCGCLDDLGDKWVKAQGDEKKLQEYKDETIPSMLAKIEKIVDQEDTFKTGFFGTKISLADLTLVAYGYFALEQNKEAFKNAPKLFKLYESISKIPEIAAWVKKRPKTEY
nr:hematopoietic prostaglandin D synthase-like isoform X2 [Styela clava]